MIKLGMHVMGNQKIVDSQANYVNADYSGISGIDAYLAAVNAQSSQRQFTKQDVLDRLETAPQTYSTRGASQYSPLKYAYIVGNKLVNPITYDAYRNQYAKELKDHLAKESGANQAPAQQAAVKPPQPNVLPDIKKKKTVMAAPPASSPSGGGGGSPLLDAVVGVTSLLGV